MFESCKLNIHGSLVSYQGLSFIGATSGNVYSQDSSYILIECEGVCHFDLASGCHSDN